jgi:hypothetical protein
MFQHFSCLHNPHNSRLYEQFSVFLNVFVSHLHLLPLLRLHGDVDVHPQLLVLIPMEQVHSGGWFNLVLIKFFSWTHKKFGLQKDLQDLYQDVHLDLGRLGQSCHSPAVSLVKSQEDRHLEGGGLEGVLVLEAVGDKLSLAHVEEPIQFSPRVLPTIKGSEPGNTSLQLAGQAEHTRLLEWPAAT